MATIKVPTDHPSIQQAVDIASMGDIIEILPGIYHESVIIKTQGIKILGQCYEKVILDGFGILKNGIRILGDKVSIENLCIQGFQCGMYMTGRQYNIYHNHFNSNSISAIKMIANDSTIDNNRFNDQRKVGIDFQGNNNHILNNVFINNAKFSIYNKDFTASNTDIAYNEIKGSLVGINIENDSNHLLQIRFNDFESNASDMVLYAPDDSYSQNTATNNLAASIVYNNDGDELYRIICDQRHGSYVSSSYK